MTVTHTGVLAVALVASLLPLACTVFDVVEETVQDVVKSSEVYARAVEKAKAHPDVRRTLGAPIQPGDSLHVRTYTNMDASGHADFTVPLLGARKSGTLQVVARKEEEVWTFETLVVTLEEPPERLDLLATGQ